MNNGYYSPSLNKYWPSLALVNVDFPNVSLPLDMDMPEIDVYQIRWPDPWPVAEEGFTIAWDFWPTLPVLVDDKYYVPYRIVERESPPE